MESWDKEIDEAASILARSTRAVASCGAGISAESGIATFRDPGGVWDTLDPAEVGTVDGLINTLERDAKKLIPLFLEMLDSFEQAEPNPGHRSLVDLEVMGILKTVITQNTDNLHQEAGSTSVIEVHGNLCRMVCVSCGRRRRFDRKSLIGDVKSRLKSLKKYTLSHLISLAPQCDLCGSMMRPDVVMFGESVQQLPEAYGAIQGCDTMLVLGTSGVVYPAASFPFEAQKRGAKVIVINPRENAFAEVTDVYIPMKTGEALPLVVNRIKELAV
jgi:NAD-dependent deacetylase